MGTRFGAGAGDCYHILWSSVNDEVVCGTEIRECSARTWYVINGKLQRRFFHKVK
jgi:hypothetical protein